MTIKNNLSQKAHHYFIYYDSVGSPINMLLEDPKNPYNPSARVNPTRKQFNFSPRVIKEKIKRIFNPNAKLNPKRKQINVLSKEDRTNIKKDVTQKKHEKIGSGILGIGDMIKNSIANRAINKFSERLMTRDAEKEDRKNRKKHTMYQEDTQVTEALTNQEKKELRDKITRQHMIRGAKIGAIAGAGIGGANRIKNYISGDDITSQKGMAKALKTKYRNLRTKGTFLTPGPLSPEQAREHLKSARTTLRNNALRYGAVVTGGSGAAGSVLGGWVGFATGRLKAEREIKKMQNTQVTEAVMDTVKNIMGHVGKHWGTLNSKARYGMRWGRVMSKKYPIASAGLKVAGGIAGTVGTGLAAHYFLHKGKMLDPNYAAETRRLTVDRKMARGDFAPIDQQVAQAQQQPIYPSHAQHYQQPSRQETMGSPEEARPQSSVNKKKGNRPVHELHNAQIAVTKHMDPEAVNRIGMSVDQSKFNLNSQTKTNTRKEDSMVIDVVMEAVGRIEEMGVIRAGSAVINAHIKPVKAISHKIADVLTKPIQKATGTRLNPGKGAFSIPKVEKVNSSVDDVIANIYEAIQGLALGAAAMVAKPVAKAVATTPVLKHTPLGMGLRAMGVGKPRPVSEDDTKQAIASRPILKKLPGILNLGIGKPKPVTEVWGTVAKIVAKPAVKAVAKHIAINAATSAASTYAAGKAQQYLDKKSAPQGQRQEAINSIMQNILGENVGSGQLSQYEFNPYKVDSNREIYKYNRNNFVKGVTGSRRRRPKNYNKPRIIPTDTPSYYAEN